MTARTPRSPVLEKLKAKVAKLRKHWRSYGDPFEGFATHDIYRIIEELEADE